MGNLETGLNRKSILLTGAAGFIGAHLAVKLLRETAGSVIVGLDNLNDYYDPALKDYRLRRIQEAADASASRWVFVKGSIGDRNFIRDLFAEWKFDIVVNMAAQAGVRYSIDHPDVYMESNVDGFYNLLEACRRNPVKHFVYASSSSVYGDNSSIPFSTEDKTDMPVSLYAATKKTDEVFAYAYAKLYGIPCTGLRFFTVYGPAGRPDMFYYSASEKMIRGEDIELFGYGECRRDYTYIDDVVECVSRVMKTVPFRGAEDGQSGQENIAVPYAVYNVGHGKPVKLMDFIAILHEELCAAGLLPAEHSLDGQLKYLPLQPGDVRETYADVAALRRDFGVVPETGFREGIRKFVEWYREYRKEEFRESAVEEGQVQGLCICPERSVRDCDRDS